MWQQGMGTQALTEAFREALHCKPVGKPGAAERTEGRARGRRKKRTLYTSTLPLAPSSHWRTLTGFHSHSGRGAPHPYSAPG